MQFMVIMFGRFGGKRPYTSKTMELEGEEVRKVMHQALQGLPKGDRPEYIFGAPIEDKTDVTKYHCFEVARDGARIGMVVGTEKVPETFDDCLSHKQWWDEKVQKGTAKNYRRTR